MINKIKLFFILLCIPIIANSQYIEDALRLDNNSFNQSARITSLGVSYLGVLNDGNALITNPAGLSLVKQSEVIFGFGIMNRNSNDLSYNSEAFNSRSSKSSINNFTVTVPYQQNISMGLTYNRDNSFNNYLQFSTYNSNNSAIDNEANNGFLDSEDNFAVWNLLADPNDYYTPISGNVQQELELRNRGSIHNLGFGLAYDWQNKISFGFSVSGKFGSFISDKIYTETDINNVYNTYFEDFTDLDFYDMQINETIDQRITGVSAEFGVIGNLNDQGRISFAVRLPEVYEIDQIFTSDAVTRFDNGDVANFLRDGNINYSIILPPEFKFGASYNFNTLTLTAGLSYSDMSSTEFQSTASQLNRLNFEALNELGDQLQAGIGAEMIIPQTSLGLALSYTYMSSPYILKRVNLLAPNSRSQSYESNIIGFGFNYFVGKSWKFDISGNYRMNSYDDVIALNGTNYNGMTVDHQNINLIMGLSYRWD